MSKRLFIFAGYDKDGIIDDTLVYYLTELSKLGDIVLVMDCDVKNTSKLKNIKNLLHIETKQHCEYDFGSYKRGYMWAYNNKVLDKYDWVYLVNDSVYGPLWDIKPILESLEQNGSDLIGMTDFESSENPLHIQSWFVGMSKKLISEQFIDEFFTSITHQEHKNLIIYKYEVGLSRLCIKNGYAISVVIETIANKDVYCQPLFVVNQGVPFIKKAVVANLHVLELLYQYCNDNSFLDAIRQNCIRMDKICPIILTPSTNVPVYKQIYQLKLFGIPLLKITCDGEGAYKVFLFGFLRILKIIIHKN